MSAIEASENGVRAGISAGMQVYGFVGGGHATGNLRQQLIHAGADQVFDSFAEISKSLVC